MCFWRLWSKLKGLRRFWVEFLTETPDERPIGAWMGCGVTAYDREDALQIVRERLYCGAPLPEVKVTEDVDISTLDPNHILPIEGNIWRRGIWFPDRLDLRRVCPRE